MRLHSRRRTCGLRRIAVPWWVDTHTLHPDFADRLDGYTPEQSYLEAFREAPD